MILGWFEILNFVHFFVSLSKHKGKVSRGSVKMLLFEYEVKKLDLKKNTCLALEMDSEVGSGIARIFTDSK